MHSLKSKNTRHYCSAFGISLSIKIYIIISAREIGLVPGSKAAQKKSAAFFDASVYVLRIFLFLLSELPFGWEKVEDPHYGTYYIE